MKKTIALLLALLLVAGTVFAEVIDITDESHGKTHGYNMNLEAVIEDGGGLDDNNGEDPSDIKNGGLYIMVGYNYKNSNGYGMGSKYNPGDLEDLGTYHTDNPLSVSLVPENASDTEGTLQFYVAAQSNTSKKYTTTVKFESDGFKKVGQEDTVNIKFSTGEEGTEGNYGLSGTTKGLTVTLGDDPQITVEAAAGSHQKGYIYVARTDATWVKSSDYTAGTYKATITVTVGTV